MSEIVSIAAMAEMLVHDRMAYYGYTPEQIRATENWPGHDASGCFFENMNWVCTDEDDTPNHPDRDELEHVAEFVMWVLEHPAMTTNLNQPATRWTAGRDEHRGENA